MTYGRSYHKEIREVKKWNDRRIKFGIFLVVLTLIDSLFFHFIDVGIFNLIPLTLIIISSVTLLNLGAENHMVESTIDEERDKIMTKILDKELPDDALPPEPKPFYNSLQLRSFFFPMFLIFMSFTYVSNMYYLERRIDSAMEYCRSTDAKEVSMDETMLKITNHKKLPLRCDLLEDYLYN